MTEQEFYDRVALAVVPIIIGQKSSFMSADDVAAKAADYAEALVKRRREFMASQPIGYPRLGGTE